MIPERPTGTLLNASKFCKTAHIQDLAPGKVLVLAPHPDDETFGCGMAIAAAVAQDIQVHIVAITSGEASHPNSQSYSSARLKTLRLGEFKRAVTTLCGNEASWQMLDFPDGKLCDGDLPRISEDIAAIARLEQAEVIWTTWEGDPHCDHEAVAKGGKLCSELLGIPSWQYAVWGRFGDRAIPAANRIWRFRDAVAREYKVCATACYQSQTSALIDDDPDGFRMPDELLAHFLDSDEIFIERAAE